MLYSYIPCNSPIYSYSFTLGYKERTTSLHKATDRILFLFLVGGESSQGLLYLIIHPTNPHQSLEGKEQQGLRLQALRSG